MLMKVIKWSNGMVMAFDERGKPILALQGEYLDVKHRVLREATQDTKFLHGNWNVGVTDPVKREEW